MSREKGKSTEGLFHEFRMRKSIEKKIKQVFSGVSFQGKIRAKRRWNGLTSSADGEIKPCNQPRLGSI